MVQYGALCRLIRFEHNGRVRVMMTSSTTFTGLKRDLRRMDRTIPSDFQILVKWGGDWATEAFFIDDVIPQDTPIDPVTQQPASSQPTPSGLFIVVEPAAPEGRYIVQTIWGTKYL